MKGTPLNPQCGYSNFVVELLKKYGNFIINNRFKRIQINKHIVEPNNS